ncbi:MAG: hypothetical protein LBE59_01995 [Nevskiaceae bacterium]|jgi:hypothetical protein|nr:hypothetical protein [Nevskiaceae bacterium]
MNMVRMAVASAVMAGLAACGADEISSPGSGGNITINNPPPSGGGTENPPPPPPPVETLVTPAAGCPTVANNPGLTDDGTISGPTGEYRVCVLPERFTASSTLTRIPGVLYAMDGRVDVGNDLGATGGAGITLTVDPGVIVFAKTGVSWLAVNRGNQIRAVGTAERPIVFTSRDNVLGIANDDGQGQWGGVVLLGRAPVTDCTVDPGATPGSANCERQTEGAVQPAYFGGALPEDSSGRMSYVQIRYSGYVLEGNSELQSLTLGGTGSGTVIDHIQAHNSSDDGFEIFGGATNLRNMVVTGADDDTVDVDTGFRGTIQYVIGVQKTSGAADSMIELDSPEANPTTEEDQQPRTFLKLANFTFIHRNATTGNGAALRLRGMADVALINGVLTTPMTALRIDGPAFLTANAAVGKQGPPVFKSVLFTAASAFRAGDGGVTADQVAAIFNAADGNNNASFVSTLTSTFIDGANEAAATATDPTSIDERFDATNYVGAVKDASDTWYAGWTCNSSTVTFSATGSACRSLPSLED